MRRLIINILTKAEQLGFSSVSIPAISSGLFGYPRELCADDIFTAIEQYALERKDFVNHLQKVRLTNYDDETVQTFLTELFDRYTINPHTKPFTRFITEADWKIYPSRISVPWAWLNPGNPNYKSKPDFKG